MDCAGLVCRSPAGVVEPAQLVSNKHTVVGTMASFTKAMCMITIPFRSCNAPQVPQKRGAPEGTQALSRRLDSFTRRLRLPSNRVCQRTMSWSLRNLLTLPGS